MHKSNKKSDKNEFPKRRIETDPNTGLSVLVGPAFTKEDVARDFPVDCCRDAVILRRSVGLGKKDPFENEGGDPSETNKKPFTKEQVAEDYPRDCCRFARFMRSSVGLAEDNAMDGSDKCCFAD